MNVIELLATSETTGCDAVGCAFKHMIADIEKKSPHDS